MKEIELTRGEVAIVDDEDFEWLNQYSWRTKISPSSRTKYAQGNGIPSMHGMVLAKAIGRPLVKGEESDHINGNGLDNRRCNLRVASRADNARNKYYPHGVSPYVGVCWSKQKNKWMARIGVNRRGYNLGVFQTEIEAAKEYDQAAYFYFKEFAKVNFPDIPPNPEWKKRGLGGTSIYRGVGWRRANRKWLVRFKTPGRRLYGGCHGNEKDAALAYDKIAWVETGDLSILNFPERFVAYG